MSVKSLVDCYRCNKPLIPSNAPLIFTKCWHVFCSCIDATRKSHVCLYNCGKFVPTESNRYSTLCLSILRSNLLHDPTAFQNLVRQLAEEDKDEEKVCIGCLDTPFPSFGCTEKGLVHRECLIATEECPVIYGNQVAKLAMRLLNTPNRSLPKALAVTIANLAVWSWLVNHLVYEDNNFKLKILSAPAEFSFRAVYYIMTIFRKILAVQTAR